MTATLTTAQAITAFSALGTALTASVAVPQLLRLRRTHDVSGISASTCAMTILAGLSWAAYGLGHHLGLLTLSSLTAVAGQVPILFMLMRAGAWSRRSQVTTGALAILYTAVGVFLGWSAMGVCLVLHVVVQYSPQVMVALRSTRLTGLSATSARILIVNGVTWGAAALMASDEPLLAWAIFVIIAGTTVWFRVATQSRRLHTATA